MPIAGAIGPPLRGLPRGLPAPAVLRRRAPAVQAITKHVPQAAERAAPIKAPVAEQVRAPPPVVRAAKGDHSRKIIGPRPARPLPAVPGAVPVLLGKNRPAPVKTLPAQANVLVAVGRGRLPQGVVPAQVGRVPIRVLGPPPRQGAPATQRRGPTE